jgi:release factor glutamine methyltransferase
MSAARSTTTWTVKALINWTADFLRQKGIDNPQKEARLLLGHVLGCEPIHVITRYDEEPDEAQKTQYRELIRKRVEGWPVAYLTGVRDFYLLTFEVSSAVLIPRPDTETLVLQAISLLKQKPNAKVLDLGTGSGCIAISLAHQCKGIQVTAVDISPDAADIARRNAMKHSVSDRVNIVVGDLFQALPAGAQFDMIVSNPPYVSRQELAELSPEVRDHEPRQALDGGPDGLAFYRRIADQAGSFLAPGGQLLLEIGYTQDTAVRDLFTQPGWELGPTLKDLAQRPRVVQVRKV